MRTHLNSVNVLHHSMIPKDVISIGKVLTDNGFEAYVVGGAVRDSLLGLTPKDWDVATNATPDEIENLFNKTIPTGKAFGTITVVINGKNYEVTTFRSDGDYGDSRHPNDVTYAKTLKEDVDRRDFTINAMALKIPDAEVFDYHEGRKDLSKSVIRTVGDPNERFIEDPLRMMRACRFASKLGFNIDKDTFEAIKNNKDKINRISKERIRDEILGILGTEDPSVGFDCLKDTGLLEIVLPEISKMVGLKQPDEFHYTDVYNHTMDVVKGLPQKEIILRLGGLLHDVGKPLCQHYDIEKKRITFKRHSQIGVEVAKRLLERLKFSNKDAEIVLNIVRNHMRLFDIDLDGRDTLLRRWLNKVGQENYVNLILIWEADRNASKDPITDEVKTLVKRLDNLPSPIVNKSTLAINGKDVMNLLGIGPGPIVGKYLNHLEEMVMENPDLNERGILIKFLKEIEKKGGIENG